MNEENEMVVKPVEDAWKTKTLIIGGVLGASVGLLAAYLFVQRVDDEATPEFSVGEGIKLGVLVFGLLRSVANLAGD